jgi:galactitol-specific phosphotransferase system IIB component
MNKITFEDLQKANETIRTTDIKGKEYAEVNQRIKAFRMVYPTGVIETEMLSNENGVCIFKASVGYREGDEIYKLATGTAYEKENSTFINKTSYIENCETSAVGRALGMCGFGIDTSVASFEEVQNAIENQNRSILIDEIKVNLLTEKAREMDIEEVKSILANYGYKKIAEIKMQDFKEIAEKLGCK